jgi:hypothetical protein
MPSSGGLSAQMSRQMSCTSGSGFDCAGTFEVVGALLRDTGTARPYIDAGLEGLLIGVGTREEHELEVSYTL